MNVIDSRKLDKLIKQKYGSNKEFLQVLNQSGVMVKEDAIKKWRQGKSYPKPNDLPTVAKLLGVSIVDLYTDSFEDKEQIALELIKSPTAKLKQAIKQYAPITCEDAIEIPFFEDAVAGAGSEAFYPEHLHESEKIAIAKRFLNGVDPKYLMFFQIVGDSMEPTIGINDWVLIELVADREFYPVSGIYLVDMDGSVQLKRLEFRGEKGIDIISDNATYRVKNTVKDKIDLKVVGKLFMHLKHYGTLAVRKEND